MADNNVLPVLDQERNMRTQVFEKTKMCQGLDIHVERQSRSDAWLRQVPHLGCLRQRLKLPICALSVGMLRVEAEMHPPNDPVSRRSCLGLHRARQSANHQSQVRVEQFAGPCHELRWKLASACTSQQFYRGNLFYAFFVPEFSCCVYPFGSFWGYIVCSGHI